MISETDYQSTKKLFKPHSDAANLRQKVWAELGKQPKKEFTLPVLARLLQIEVKGLYPACAHLAKKGLIRRASIKIPAPTKKDPAKVKSVTAVCYVEPWTEKTEKKW